MSPGTKLRLRFAKRHEMRLVSHHDLMRCVERALRRAELPMAQSQGFNPRPRMVFPLALALGIEGRREVLDLELSEALLAETVRSRLAAVAPPGLDFTEAEIIPPGRAPQVATALYMIQLPSERIEPARNAVAELLRDERRPFSRHRPERTIQIDLRHFLLSAEIDERGDLRFRLKMEPGGSARPEEILETLGLRDLLSQGAALIRSDVELAP